MTYSPEHTLLRSHWVRAVNSCEYRQSITAACQMFRSTGASSWLADARTLSSPNMTDQNWTAGLLGRCLPNTNMRKIAIILPDDLFLEVVAEKIAAQIERMTPSHIQINHFAHEQLALCWLVSMSEHEGLFRDTLSLPALRQCS